MHWNFHGGKIWCKICVEKQSSLQFSCHIFISGYALVEFLWNGQKLLLWIQPFSMITVVSETGHCLHWVLWSLKRASISPGLMSGRAKGQCTELHPASLLHYYSGDEPIALQKKTLCGQSVLSGLMLLILIFHHRLPSQQNRMVEIALKTGTKWGGFVTADALWIAKWVHYETYADVLDVFLTGSQPSL